MWYIMSLIFENCKYPKGLWLRPVQSGSYFTSIKVKLVIVFFFHWSLFHMAQLHIYVTPSPIVSNIHYLRWLKMWDPVNSECFWKLLCCFGRTSVWKHCVGTIKTPVITSCYSFSNWHMIVGLHGLKLQWCSDHIVLFNAIKVMT